MKIDKLASPKLQTSEIWNTRPFSVGNAMLQRAFESEWLVEPRLNRSVFIQHIHYSAAPFGSDDQPPLT